jgi:hypothetical protein
VTTILDHPRRLQTLINMYSGRNDGNLLKTPTRSGKACTPARQHPAIKLRTNRAHAFLGPSG